MRSVAQTDRLHKSSLLPYTYLQEVDVVVVDCPLDITREAESILKLFSELTQRSDLTTQEA